MVLLKNNDAILPLKKQEKVAVIGKFAKQPRFQGGGSSHINSFQTTSAWDVLGTWPNVTYADGYDIDQDAPDEQLLAEAEAIAQNANVAVIFAGLPDSFESEGYDRTHMRMPTCMETLIERVAAINPNTVVVLYNGSPVEMPWIGKVKAVLEAYLGGQAAGAATVDVLYGDQNPCGRLPESFPLHLEDNPSYLWYGGEKNVAEYREGVFVGYRWYDKKNIPVLFPFGYGLSYTTFRYHNLTLSSDQMMDTDTLTVSVDVTNTGAVTGKEVVQLYVADRESTVIRPIRELKAFDKVELAPGETGTVVFQLDKRAFAYWNTQLHDWHVETGMFGIQIGRSSRDIVLEQDVEITSSVQLPERITLNTIFMDLKDNPKAMAMIQPLVDEMSATFSHHGEGAGEVAESAVSKDMMMAMIDYTPIRSMLSFSNGAFGYDRLVDIVEQLNNME